MSIITDSQISTKNKISYYFCHIFDPETQVYSYYLEYKNEAIIIDPIFSFFQEYTQIFEKRKTKLAYVGITHLSARVIWGYQYFFSNYFQYKKQNLTLILGENYKYAETALPSIAKFGRIIANKRIQQIVLGEDINIYFISTPSVTDCSMVFWTNEFIFTGALLGFEKCGIICPYNYEKILDTEYNFYAKQFTTSLQRIFNLNPDLIIYPSIHMGNKQYVNLWEIQQMIDFKNEQESLETFQNELINQWKKQNQNLQQYKRDILIKNTYNDPYQLAYESGEIDEKYISDYLNEKQNQQTIVLLDTRDRQLFMRNHLKNSINICPELSITRMVPLLFDSTSYFILIDEDIKKCQTISDKLNNIGLFNRVGYFTTKGKILENFVFNNIKMNKELEIPEIEEACQFVYSNGNKNKDLYVDSLQQTIYCHQNQNKQGKLAIMKPSLQTSQRYKIEFRFNNFNQETNQLIGIGIYKYKSGSHQNQNFEFSQNQIKQNKNLFIITGSGIKYSINGIENFQKNEDFGFNPKQNVEMEINFKDKKITFINLTTYQQTTINLNEVFPQDKFYLCSLLYSEGDDIQIIKASKVKIQNKKVVKGKSNAINRYQIYQDFNKVRKITGNFNTNNQFPQLIKLSENQINPFGKAQFHCKFTKMVKPNEIAFGVFHKQEIEHENNSFGKNWKQSIEDNQLQYIVFANDDNNQRKYGNQQFTGISIDPNFTHHNLITIKNTLEVKQVNLYNGEQTASFKKIKCGKCKKDLHLIEENPYNEMSLEQTTGFNCCKCQKEGKIFEKFYHCDCEIVNNRIKSGKEAKQTCFDICVDCYDQGHNESQNKKNEFLCQLCSSTLLEQQQIYIDDEWECDICGEQIDKMGFDFSYQCQQQCKIQQFNVCKECYKQEDNRCISFLQPSLRNVVNMRYILQIKVEKLNKKGFLGIGIINEEFVNSDKNNFDISSILQSQEKIVYNMMTQTGNFYQNDQSSNEIGINKFSKNKTNLKIHEGDTITMELNSEQNQITFKTSRSNYEYKQKITQLTDSKYQFFICLNKPRDSVIIEKGLQRINTFNIEEGDSVIAQKLENNLLKFTNLRTQQYLDFQLNQKALNQNDPIFPVAIIGDKQDIVEFSNSDYKIAPLLPQNFDGILEYNQNKDQNSYLQINKSYQFTFKIQNIGEISSIGLGACIFSKVKSKNFTLDTEIEDHGVYLINNDGIVYSCLEKHLNGKKIPITKNSQEKINNDKERYFTFKNGDIIKLNLIFEKRILEFQNCNTGHQFQLMIDVNYENEIFPCIMLMSHEDVIHCIQGKELRNFEENNQIEIKKIENLTSWEFKQYYQLQQFSDAQEIVDIQKIYNDQLENLKDQQLSVSFYQQKQRQSQKIDLSQSLEFNQSFRQFVKNENMIVVDVRLENEYRFGSLPGAIKCPLNNLPQLGEKLADKKDKQIFIFSLQGYISVLAISILAYLGFEKLVNIFDGFIGLQQQGFQDVKEIYIPAEEDYNITDDESDKFKLTDQQIEEQKKQNEFQKEKSNLELTEIDKKQSFQNWRDRMPKNSENDDIPDFYIPKSEKRQRQQESQSYIINNQTEQNSNEQFTKNEHENKHQNIDNSVQQTQSIQNNVIKLNQNSENLQKIQRNLQYSQLQKQNEYQTPQKNIQNLKDKKSQNFQDENQQGEQNNGQKQDNNTYNKNNQNNYQKSEYKGSIIDQQPLVQSVFKKDSQLFQDLNFAYNDIENQNRIEKDQKHNQKSLRSSLLNTNKKSGVQKKVNFDIQEYQKNIQEEEN